MTKVPAHVELGASLSADQRRKAKGNAAADEEAKAAAARQPRAARREQGEWDNDWSDAVVTAKLIAAVAKLWPAARAPSGRPPSARIAESEGRAERKRAERDEAKRRREANWAYAHLGEHARGPSRCHFCKVLASHRGAAEERECPRSLPQWTEVAVREAESGTSGHRLLIGLVERQGDPPSAFLMCDRCGGFGEVKQSSLLAGQCRGRPGSASAAYSIHRLGNGQFPRPGAASVGTIVAQVYPVARMRSFLAL